VGEKSPEQQKSPSDEINKISDVINKSIVKNYYKKEQRKYIGASSLGDECARKIQYRFMGQDPDHDKSFGAQTLRIFEFGHSIESMKSKWIIDAGFDLKTEDKNGNQFGFSVLDGKIKGHVDGIIYGGPIDLKYPLLWECKSANDRKFKEFVRSGLRKTNPVYAAQVALYQAYMELHENPALFTVMNKNTCEVYYELVPFNQTLAQQTSDKAVEIIKATEASEMMPKVASNKDYFGCKYCDFTKTCWEVAL
tara:strand:- start:290 stop:1042 length:753 start_codon:yes stop_codon:yes gene_type:complete